MPEGFGGFSDDASQRARDAANGNFEEDMGAFGQPHSLEEAASQGVSGAGLSDFDNDDVGMNFKQAFPDEVNDNAIHAALEDEEIDNSIKAGRTEEDVARANDTYGSYGEDRTSFSGGGGAERSSFAGNAAANQSIDDIFIANSYGNARTSSSSSGGGTMYQPKNQTNVHMSVGMPKWLKRIIGLAVFLVLLYCGLEYGLGMHLEYYKDPIQLQKYDSAQSLTNFTGLKFDDAVISYVDASVEYTYNVQKHNESVRYYYIGENLMYTRLEGMRFEYSIYGVRPYLCKLTDATLKLTPYGFADLGLNSNYTAIDGNFEVYYNSSTDEVVLCEVESNKDTVKGVYYIKSKRMFETYWKKIGGTIK